MQHKTIFNKLSDKSRHVVYTSGQMIREDCFLMLCKSISFEKYALIYIYKCYISLLFYSNPNRYLINSIVFSLFGELLTTPRIGFSIAEPLDL